MDKTLVAYQTLYGATKQAALKIAKVLKEDYNLKVDIHRFEENKNYPNLDDYDNLVVGSCIFYGKWGKSAENFLKYNFNDKKIATFICSGFAGEEELYFQAHKNFLEGVLEAHPNVKPVAMEAFGGRIPKAKIPHVWFLQVTKRLPKFRYDNTNLSKVEQWAHEVGKIFTGKI